MTTSNTKSKFREDNESIVTTTTKKKQSRQPLVDFMPYWKNEEAQFKNAIVRDMTTKKIIEGGWPRPHSTDQWAYENWLSKVVNQETGNWFQARNEEGIPIEGTGARHVINVITRARDAKGKNEYLLSKGSLIGYDAGGIEKRYPIVYPERWKKTEFAYQRNYNENTGAFTTQTTGPSKTEDVYEIPFTADNVRKLYEKVEDDDCTFVLKDLNTGEAKSVSWSSTKDSLDLFCNKSWLYLWRADYMPLPLKQELRQEGVAQGLIKGVASDYSMQSSSTGSAGVE